MEEKVKIMDDLLDVLKNTKLFKEVSEDRILLFLERTHSVSIEKEEILFEEGENYHKGVYYILDGEILLENKAGNTTKLSNGDIVGLTTFIGKSTYSFTAKALKNSNLLYLPEICIYKLMTDSEYFKRTFYQLTQDRLKLTTDDGHNLSLSTHTYKAVGSHMTSPIITAKEDTLVTEASAIMSNHKIGALIITKDDNDIAGLVNTKHVVHKFLPLIEEKGLNVKVSEIMDKTPIVVPKDYPLIEVLSEMQSKDKDYAIIIKEFKPIGIISNKDIMRTIYRTASTMSFHVDNTTTLTELKNIKDSLFKVAKNLINNSRLTSEVLKTISSLHISIQRRTFDISVNEYYEKTGFNAKDVDFCLIIMGSGARREMMLDPDQDNGFIFDDNITDEQREHMMKLGEIYINHLEYVGYEKCPGNIMVTNPEMSKTISEWKKNVFDMINNPGQVGLLWSSIVFDLSGFYGNESLLWNLKSYILKLASTNDVFLLQLYENEANYSVPLSIFGNFITIKEGKHKGMIDLKTSAMSFIVFIGRLYSLKSGINDTNTIDRFKHLKRIKAMDDTLVDTTLHAYEIITDLTFREQIKKAENGEELNKVINPKMLSVYNRQKLKEAFGEIQNLLNAAKRKFKRM
jgi:CBS domain-containing protein